MQCIMCSDRCDRKIILSERYLPVCRNHKHLQYDCLICFEHLRKGVCEWDPNLEVHYRCPRCKLTIKTHKYCLEKFAEGAAKELKCFFCSDSAFRDYVLALGIPVPEGECVFNEDEPKDSNKEITCNAACSRDEIIGFNVCQACGSFFHVECLMSLESDLYCSVCISVFRTEDPPQSLETDTESQLSSTSQRTRELTTPTSQEQGIQEMPSPDKEYHCLGTIDLLTDSENDDVEHLLDLMGRPTPKRPRIMPLPLPPPPPTRHRINPDHHYVVYHSEDYRYKL